MADTWAGIVRVSHMGTRRTGANDFHSERDQIAALHQAVARLGGKLDILPSELDVSGGLPLEERPSLLAAVEGVEQSRYRGIVVAYQSRLGRDVEHEEAVWRRVEAAGGRVEMALDGIDTTTVDGKMIRRIRSAMNTAERERHTERFDELRKWATEAGIWQRRQTPRGYDRDPATRRLVPNTKAEEVRWAFRARAAGTAVVVIADRLKMTPNGIRGLLRNRVYLGELRVGDYFKEAAHDALVTPDEFDGAQNTVARPSSVVGRGPALLAGLVRCAGCGYVMTRGGDGKHPVYICSGRHSGGRCPQPAAITVRLLDEHVSAIARAELAGIRVRSAESGGHTDAARVDLVAAERELAAYLQAVDAAGLAPGEFAAGARRRREQIDVARDRLQRHLRVRAVAPIYDEALEAWEQLGAHERNTLLRGLLGGVIVRRAGGRGARARFEDRVRVLDADAVLPPPGIFPDLGDPHALGVSGGEDPLEGAGG